MTLISLLRLDMSALKIPLREWAAARYRPAPPDSTLLRWAREDQIQPPPEKVGRGYMVLETAERVAVPAAVRQTLVDRLRRAGR